MDYTEILFSFIRQVIASMIGIYIAYAIIKKWEKYHGKRSTPKGK